MWPFDSAILSSPFLDDRFLFRGYGLTRIDAEEFRSVYRELPPAERPPLSPYLDANWYGELDAELTETDWDPFSHFVNQGFKQRRSPHPLIKLDYIERHHGQLADGPAGLEALVEILRAGSTQPSPYFEQTYYLKANPEAAAFPSGPLGHFLEAPDDRCSIPCQFFDPDFYRSRYADVPPSKRGAFLHFCAYGDRQRRFPSAEFDPDLYFHRNVDFAESGVSPLYHFLEFGRHEGRAPRDERRRMGGYGAVSGPGAVATLLGPRMAALAMRRSKTLSPPLGRRELKPSPKAMPCRCRFRI